MKIESEIVIYPVSYTGLSKILVRRNGEVVDEELTDSLVASLENLKKKWNVKKENITEV